MTALESTRPATPRVRLARIAERVIEADAGVAGTAGSGRRLTRDGGRTIAGVVVAETAAGRIDVELHLVVAATAVPLAQTASALRAALAGEAARAGLGDRLGAIDIAFEDLAAPDERPGAIDGARASSAPGTIEAPR